MRDHAADRATVLSTGRRLRALRCAATGHRWQSQPTATGVVLLLCERCAELVAAPFVDQPDVSGCPPPRGRPPGSETPAAPGRHSTWPPPCSPTTGPPGSGCAPRPPPAPVPPSTPSLTLLCALLARVASDDPLRVVHDVAHHLEASLLEQHLAAAGRLEQAQ